METYGLNWTEHTYTLAATGLKMKTYSFGRRELANQKMYKIMRKYGLTLNEVYDDKHFKTYICTNGVRFYIQRV